VNVREALKGIDWHGRILIDATNADTDAGPDISLAGGTASTLDVFKSLSEGTDDEDQKKED
jgi:hypothetical protein